MTAAVPVEQVRAPVRLLSPAHLTPVAAQQFEKACQHAETDERVRWHALLRDPDVPLTDALAATPHGLRHP